MLLLRVASLHILVRRLSPLLLPLMLLLALLNVMLPPSMLLVLLLLMILSVQAHFLVCYWPPHILL